MELWKCPCCGIEQQVMPGTIDVYHQCPANQDEVTPFEHIAESLPLSPR